MEISHSLGQPFIDCLFLPDNELQLSSQMMRKNEVRHSITFILQNYDNFHNPLPFHFTSPLDRRPREHFLT